jgi:hypothetical protein
MLENLHLESFSQHLNSKFSVKRESAAAVELELVDAQGIESNPAYEQFSLFFRGPLDSFLEQATYSFEHDGLGSFEMFIVPIRRNQDGFQYQSVIYRVR